MNKTLYAFLLTFLCVGASATTADYSVAGTTGSLGPYAMIDGPDFSGSATVTIDVDPFLVEDLVSIVIETSDVLIDMSDTGTVLSVSESYTLDGFALDSSFDLLSGLGEFTSCSVVTGPDRCAELDLMTLFFGGAIYTPGMPLLVGADLDMFIPPFDMLLVSRTFDLHPVPVPAAWLLFASAGAVLTRLRRRAL